MTTIRLPHNNWQPRSSQRKLWLYLEGGGKRAAAVWHRRSGKDEVCLHWTAVASQQRVGTYWHMLPEASQARKAIWNAVNPHTGLRRIDEAFPEALRANTNDHEMFIRFTNGSTWQVVGSDNYNSLVGSPPIGVVFSEWAIANPQSWAFLRPILKENEGWAIFVYTPRGRNHGETTFINASKYDDWFAEMLTVDQTEVFTLEQVADERRELMDEYGRDLGEAYYRQEYECSFSAAVLGSVYGAWIEKAQEDGRIGVVPYDPGREVYVSADLGYGDATALWFFQIYTSEIHYIDYYEASGQDVAHYCDILDVRGYKYVKHLWLPHDAKAATLAGGGRSIRQQFWNRGYHSLIVPAATDEAKIQAGRATFKTAWFDAEKTADGLAALGSYRYDWDQERKKLGDRPVHDWSSHGSDSFGYGALMWRKLVGKKPEEPVRYQEGRTINEILKHHQEGL